MEKLIKIAQDTLIKGPMDSVGIGVIDFKENSFSSFEMDKVENCLSLGKGSEIYFDLASLTKPLTNSLSYFLRPQEFDPKILLCLNHRGGLPAWGLLPKSGWKEQILSYPIKESPTLYSDFSALRVMLELEEKGIDQKSLCREVWDQETIYWIDLPGDVVTRQTGYKHGLPNYGQVHDPNAWTIGEFCSHAGLFSTTSGLCRTLLTYQRKTDFIMNVKADLETHSHRFAFGWDRVENPQNTLAGNGCGKFTFGHLGFTGTSIWIDPEAMKGHVILTNVVKEHWFDKSTLGELRKTLGEAIWKGDL